VDTVFLEYGVQMIEHEVMDCRPECYGLRDNPGELIEIPIAESNAASKGRSVLFGRRYFLLVLGLLPLGFRGRAQLESCRGLSRKRAMFTRKIGRNTRAKRQT
jgi:hypothetical protein